MARRPKGILRGRFESDAHPALERINRSFDVDRRLWREDVDGSIAHAEMLGARRILPAASVRRIVGGLRRVALEFERGTFRARPTDEDVHMAIERRLTELIGPDGGRLHTARSRNDQVATDLRVHLLRASSRLAEKVRDLQRVLVRRAERDGGAILPFYTHLQRAQPILLGHALLAWVEMLEKDREGLAVSDRDCPLGSGAGAGVGFPVDRRRTARSLGFRSASRNSLESVSSRREASAFLASLALLATTLSRLGAEIVLWTSREFGFARLSDRVSTGSSIMPQKRNPDGAELLRAKAALVQSALAALLEIQRGLPLGYSKDLQEDKALVFGAEDSVEAMLDAAVAMAEGISFDPRRMRAAVEDPQGYLLATEAADHLARRGVPFREAHRAVGALVREAEETGVGLDALPFSSFRRAHPRFGRDVFRALTPEAAVAARRAPGGTAPGNVRREIARWKRALARRGGRGSGSPRAAGRG